MRNLDIDDFFSAQKIKYIEWCNAMIGQYCTISTITFLMMSHIIKNDAMIIVLMSVEKGYNTYLPMKKICRKFALESMVLCWKYAFFVIFHTFWITFRALSNCRTSTSPNVNSFPSLQFSRIKSFSHPAHNTIFSRVNRATYTETLYSYVHYRSIINWVML